MLKNYLKIAWRSLWKNKIFSLINILGLSAGIAFAMLIGAYTWSELQVDQHLKNINNQYIIQSKWKDPNTGSEDATIGELPKTLKADFPSLVANYYGSASSFTDVTKYDKHFREHVLVGDSTLLTMYGFKLLYGNAKTALSEPYSVVITPEMATKYFNRQDVVGETLSFNDFYGDSHDYIITGVFDKLPPNTIMGLSEISKFQICINSSGSKPLRTIGGWENSGVYGHVELQSGADPKAVDRAMSYLINKNETDESIKKSLTPYLVPLKAYYLQANTGLVKKMTWTLSCIALFVLLMAVINFVNICIGRSSGRMKEMGLRKVMGGLRKHLIWQFLAESVLMVILATLLALIMYIIARPYFDDALGKSVPAFLNFPAYFIAFPCAFALLLGLLAGLYPALVLSAAATIDALKGKLSSVKESVSLRKTLVAFQFITAAVVVIGAIIISQQVNLFFNGNLGYNKNCVVYIQAPRDWTASGLKKMEAIRDQLVRMPQVSNASLSWEIPDGMDMELRKTSIYRLGKDPSQAINTQDIIADNHFAETFNIQLKAGQFLNPVIATDSDVAVINETELKALGWKNAEDAIGQKVRYQENDFTICGVAADFHFASLHERIQPMVFTNINYINMYRYMSVQLKPGNMPASIEALQKEWSALMPQAPFAYNFMDEALNRLYATEIQLKKAAYIATALAAIIVLLGVLGLISLSIQKRTREIGIRKVLGASVQGITGLFLKDFLGVLVIAGLIACPLAWLIMQKWLDDYAYKISITLYPFVISMVSIALITALLIVILTMRVAFTSPVKSLKSE